MNPEKMPMRARMRRLRGGLDPAWGAAAGEHLLARCPPPPGAVVAGFWPMGSEIDIRPLLHELAARGTVVLPVTPAAGQKLRFRRWQPGDPMVAEPFGTMAPTGEEMVPDILLVPLLAFDEHGYRLGYGGGFYDRTLAGLPGRMTIGCAFAAQQVDRVPREPHDIRLDAVATERGVLFFKD